MHALWLWLIAVGGQIAIALRLASSNPAVQRMVVNIQWYADRILLRARDIWLIASEEAATSGRMIASRMPIAEQAVKEYWVEIERQLLQSGVARPAIDELRSQLVRAVYDKWLMKFTMIVEPGPRGNLPFL